MRKILGYGEDALTLWALKHNLNAILDYFNDKTAPPSCLVFYRPSFGRSGGKNSSEFGEFDAIIASSENVYLVESKWDNLGKTKNYKDIIKPVQRLRHDILSWYLTHWDKKYRNKWGDFIKEQKLHYQEETKKRNMPGPATLLTRNLEFVLGELLKHCKGFSGEDSIKNVLLFFYSKKKPGIKTKERKDFDLVFINYSTEVTDRNFITLD